MSVFADILLKCLMWKMIVSFVTGFGTQQHHLGLSSKLLAQYQECLSVITVIVITHLEWFPSQLQANLCSIEG